MKTKVLLVLLAVLLVIFLGLFLIILPSISADRPAKTISMTLIASPSSILADNTQTSLITASLPCSKKSVYKNVLVSFTTTLGALSATQASTNDSCKASVTIKSSQIGSSQVSASYSTAVAKTTVQFTDPNNTTLLTDDFSGTLAKWLQVYDGYGLIAIENGELSLAPKASTQPTETHAPLVVAGENTWGDVVFTSRMKTVEQLRTGSAPNAWEVGWLIFRYTDDNHFYYFIHKPNGFELGKEILNASGQQDQQFLVTETSPTLVLNEWNDYKVELKGANIKVYINNNLVADYTDANNPYLTGKIGLYNEDAHTHHDNVAVSIN